MPARLRGCLRVLLLLAASLLPALSHGGGIGALTPMSAPTRIWFKPDDTKMDRGNPVKHEKHIGDERVT